MKRVPEFIRRYGYHDALHWFRNAPKGNGGTPVDLWAETCQWESTVNEDEIRALRIMVLNGGRATTKPTVQEVIRHASAWGYTDIIKTCLDHFTLVIHEPDDFDVFEAVWDYRNARDLITVEELRIFCQKWFIELKNRSLASIVTTREKFSRIRSYFMITLCREVCSRDSVFSTEQRMRTYDIFFRQLLSCGLRLRVDDYCLLSLDHSQQAYKELCDRYQPFEILVMFASRKGACLPIELIRSYLKPLLTK